MLQKWVTACFCNLFLPGLVGPFLLLLLERDPFLDGGASRPPHGGGRDAAPVGGGLARTGGGVHAQLATGADLELTPTSAKD